MYLDAVAYKVEGGISMNKIKLIKVMRTLVQQKRMLQQQRNRLALFLAQGKDKDTVVCYPMHKANLCPFDSPPYEIREGVCAACVIRVICET